MFSFEMLISGMSSLVSAEFPAEALHGLLFVSVESFWLIDAIIDSFLGLLSSGAVAFSS